MKSEAMTSNDAESFDTVSLISELNFAIRGAGGLCPTFSLSRAQRQKANTHFARRTSHLPIFSSYRNPDDLRVRENHRRAS